MVPQFRDWHVADLHAGRHACRLPDFVVLPFPSQVIAQGSQDIIDQPMQWQVRFATVDSVTRNMPYIFNGGFVFAPDKQLLVARDGIEASLLSLGQAMFASARVDHLVYSAADVESRLMTVALVPVGSTDTGALTTPFTLAPDPITSSSLAASWLKVKSIPSTAERCLLPVHVGGRTGQVSRRTGVRLPHRLRPESLWSGRMPSR
ncbi:MAG: hypothetical protein M9950_04750 [Thermomicrobiales bacterium]|nr:hypothetical protein [Thermomicrobiales bacterium]